MALSHRHRPAHRGAPAASATPRSTTAAGLAPGDGPAWRRLVPAADKVFAVAALAAALAVFADFAATF